MDKVTRYILSNFFQTFLSLFFTLFFLASIVFFIKISKLTQLFSVSFLDLGESYLYLLPEIIIYTMPMTFFISVTMSIFKLSRDNESIVLFALSWSPLKLAKIFLWVSLLTSLFLLANSVLFMPLSKQLNKNFIEYKKIEAKINIQDSEFGQKFQEWNVFISSSGEKSYKDIILYKHPSEKNSDETLILASSAKIESNSSLFSLVLNDGKVFNINQNQIKQIDYERLQMNYLPKVAKIRSDTIWEYWEEAKVNKTRAKDLSINVMISFFPLGTFLFALAFSITNVRHEKPNIYPMMFLVILVYYLMMYKVSLTYPWGAIGVVIVTHITSYIYFRRKILRRY